MGNSLTSAIGSTDCNLLAFCWNNGDAHSYITLQYSYAVVYVYGTYANIAFRLKKVKPGPCGKILSINNFAIKFPSKIVGDQIIMSKTNIVNIYRYKTIEAHANIGKIPTTYVPGNPSAPTYLKMI